MTRVWIGLPEHKAAGLPDIAAALGNRLHDAGLSVTPERSSRFAEAVILVNPKNVDQLYWVARATLVASQEQISLFDQVFEQIFRGTFDLVNRHSAEPHNPSATSAGSGEKPPNQSERQSEGRSTPSSTSATPGPSAVGDISTHDVSVLAAVSNVERLNDRPFSELSEQELELIRSLVEKLPVIPPMRKGRRKHLHHQGKEWDVRATLRKAHRTGGDPVNQVMRNRVPKPRKIILIADVSGSMEPYARVYLHLLRGAVTAIGAEAFVFATKLTYLTRTLRTTQTELAYRKTAVTANDWSGGTKIGPAIKQFIDVYGRRGMARGAVVVIVSDGWETGDPAELARAMQQLSRLAHHVIWVNPRKASDDYQPLVGGMAAALPYVDTFLSGHSLDALQRVMQAIHQASDRAMIPPRSNAS